MTWRGLVLLLWGALGAAAAALPLDMERDLWRLQGLGTTVPSMSVISGRSGAQLGQSLLAVGDLDGDGASDLLAGGGRVGDGVEAGGALLLSPAADRARVELRHTFQGPVRRPGFGRFLAQGPGVGGRPGVMIGRLAGRDLGVLEFWQFHSGGGWRKLSGPSELMLDDLAAACLPGDVDGDGFPDLLVAVADPSERAEVRVFPGGTNGFSQRGRTFWEVERAPGRALNFWPAGDVNGDGKADWFLARPGTTNGPASGGVLDLFLGGAFTGELRVAASWTGGAPADRFGTVVHLADLDADGRVDLLVGAPGASTTRGCVRMFPARKSGWASQPAFRIEGPRDGDDFGSALATGHFTRKSGPLDLAVGAPGWKGTHAGEGAVMVVSDPEVRSGRMDGLNPVLYVGSTTRAGLGLTVVNGGDLDADGFDELVFGLSQVSHTPNKGGRIEVIWGGAHPPGSGATNEPGYPKDPYVLAVARQQAERIPATGSERTRPAGWVWGGFASGLVACGFGLWHWRRRIVRLERRRIARDLHDELGGHLVRLREPSPGTHEDGSAAESARRLAAGIERTIWSIHPDRRTLRDLACGLTDLSENLLGDTTIRRRFDIPLELPPTTPSAEVLDAVYRVVQEALTNARKHSRAKQVTVTLRITPAELVVCVVDDGVGLLPDAASRRGGLGLEAMVSRLVEVGGTCAFEPHLPSGLTVRIGVPLPR